MFSSRTRSRTTSVFALVTLAGLASSVLAGPLSPPAGPVTSTGKTLTEVEPRIALTLANTPGDTTDSGDTTPSIFKITSPGSYYLTGNLNVPAGLIGIELSASDITVDLNGFEISNGESGVGATTTTVIDVAVINGRISSAVTGVNFITAYDSSIRNVRISSCSIGVRTQAGCTIERCNINNCTTGVRYLQGGQTVRDTQFYSNSGNNVESVPAVYEGFVFDRVRSSGGASGVLLPQARSVVATDSHFSDTTGTGLSVGDNAEIRDCRFEACATGLRAGWNAVVNDNFFVDSSVVGMQIVGINGRIERNHLSTNAIGIQITGTDNLVIGNSVKGGTTRYSIVAGNRVATIATPATNALINGSSGGNNLSTDPNANFAY